MKIIKFDEKNPYAELLYDRLDAFLHFGCDYLPKIFLKKVYFDGHTLHMPRWITKREWDGIEKHAQELADKINWE